MRSPHRDPWPAAPEFEHIARFGDAEIVKDLCGRLSLRGGTPEDQAAARAWAARFLHGPLHETRPLRYTVMSRPERPAPPQPPLPPPHPEPAPEERLRQYLTNNSTLQPARRVPNPEGQA